MSRTRYFKNVDASILYVAVAGYDAFTIKAIMGHRDMKTTERYIRANRLTQEVVFQRVHKLATKQERPPLTVAVSS